MQEVVQIINSSVGRLKNADNLFAPEASRMRIELVSVLATVNTELAKAEANYKKVKLAARGLKESAADAKIFSEAQPEYQTYLELRAQKDSILEIVRSIRDFTRTLEQERLLTPSNNL